MFKIFSETNESDISYTFRLFSQLKEAIQIKYELSFYV